MLYYSCLERRVRQIMDVVKCSHFVTVYFGIPVKRYSYADAVLL